MYTNVIIMANYIYHINWGELIYLTQQTQVDISHISAGHFII